MAQKCSAQHKIILSPGATWLAAPLLPERLADDALRAFRADADEGDRYLYERLDALDVGDGLGGQVIEVRCAASRHFPAFHLLINRLAPGQVDRVRRRRIQRHAIETVPGADLYRFQLIEDVETG